VGRLPLPRAWGGADEGKVSGGVPRRVARQTERGVTGVPVSVAEKEREFVPVGVTTNVAKEPAETQTGEEKPRAPPAQETATGTVNVTSNPDGTDVYADGQFVGNSPAVLKLNPGKHTVTVKLSGHPDWSREITVESGSEVRLAATLEQ